MMALPSVNFAERHAVIANWQGTVWNYRRIALLALALNTLSALLFISFFDRPVYDDANNFPDVQRYASEAVSIDSIRHHRNPTGPTSFIWMAEGLRLLGGKGLRDARLASLVSWLILGTGILVVADKNSFPQFWYAAFLVTLVFPHSVSTSALVLTEGPALLFALIGLLAWLEIFSRTVDSPRFVFLGIIGGLSLGIAVTCRQYFLALLPAAFCFAIYQLSRNRAMRNGTWFIAATLSLLAASVPVLMLVFVWRNLSSPGMVAGASYAGQEARVGLNFFRPLIAAFYTAAYLVPFTFPAMFRLKTSQRRIGLLVAALGGISITYFSSFFLQPGPLNSLIRMASRLPYGGTVLFAVIAIGVIYNAASVCCLLWDQRHSISSRAPVVFAIFAVAFFIAEQFGVGGNLPFYDRYVLQIAPFLGLITFTVLPRLTPSRLTALACLSLLSHGMLWRFAFGP